MRRVCPAIHRAGQADSSSYSLQYQLSRFARGGPRARKIGIVALARKLLVALWRYLETGVLPEGAVLKP